MVNVEFMGIPTGLDGFPIGLLKDSGVACTGSQQCFFFGVSGPVIEYALCAARSPAM